MKGLILKIENGKAYIMNNDGSFKTVPALSNWQTGQVVTLKQKSTVAKNMRWAASVAACFVVLLVGGLYLWNTPVAYVDVAVNPNVELGLNRFDRIISVDGLNNDGKKLIEKASIKGMTVNEAYLQLLDLLNGKGYLSKVDAKIKLDVSHNNKSSREKLNKALDDLTNGFIRQHNLGCEFNSTVMSVPDYMNTHHGNGTGHEKETEHNGGKSSAPTSNHQDKQHSETQKSTSTRNHESNNDSHNNGHGGNKEGGKHD